MDVENRSAAHVPCNVQTGGNNPCLQRGLLLTGLGCVLPRGAVPVPPLRWLKGGDEGVRSQHCPGRAVAGAVRVVLCCLQFPPGDKALCKACPGVASRGCSGAGEQA